MDKLLLKKIVEIPAVSGEESLLSAFLKKKLSGFNGDLVNDGLGSWYLRKPASKSTKNPSKILIEAHMDEVGFFVTDITDSGFLKVEMQGHVQNFDVQFQSVNVYSYDLKKSFKGTFARPRVKYTPLPEKSVPQVEDMYIDILMKSKKDVEDSGIRTGSVVVFDTQIEFTKDRVMCRAADNKVGVSLVMELAEWINKQTFDFDIIIGFSTQEEVGLRGARTSSFKIEPDLAIVVDISPAYDIPSPSPHGSIGNGTYIRYMDALALYKKSVTGFLEKVYKDNKIKWQPYFSSGATNAGIIHLSRDGVRTIPVGLLARNIHSANAIFDIEDYDATLKGLQSIIGILNNKKITTFKKEI